MARINIRAVTHLYFNSKKINGNKRKNLLEKREDRMAKSDRNKDIGLTMPIIMTFEINPVIHCNRALYHSNTQCRISNSDQHCHS